MTLFQHMRSATRKGRNDMGEKVIINIKTFADGHRPPDRVLPNMLEPPGFLRCAIPRVIK